MVIIVYSCVLVCASKFSWLSIKPYPRVYHRASPFAVSEIEKQTRRASYRAFSYVIYIYTSVHASIQSDKKLCFFMTIYYTKTQLLFALRFSSSFRTITLEEWNAIQLYTWKCSCSFSRELDILCVSCYAGVLLIFTFSTDTQSKVIFLLFLYNQFQLYTVYMR